MAEPAVRAMHAELIADHGGRGGLREVRRRATGKHQWVEASVDVTQDLADDRRLREKRAGDRPPLFRVQGLHGEVLDLSREGPEIGRAHV